MTSKPTTTTLRFHRYDREATVVGALRNGEDVFVAYAKSGAPYILRRSAFSETAKGYGQGKALNGDEFIDAKIYDAKLAKIGLRVIDEQIEQYENIRKQWLESAAEDADRLQSYLDAGDEGVVIASASDYDLERAAEHGFVVEKGTPLKYRRIKPGASVSYEQQAPGRGTSGYWSRRHGKWAVVEMERRATQAEADCAWSVEGRERVMKGELDWHKPLPAWKHDDDGAPYCERFYVEADTSKLDQAIAKLREQRAAYMTRNGLEG
jgi:hypothetical protein